MLLEVDKNRVANIMDKKPYRATIYSHDVHLRSRLNVLLLVDKNRIAIVMDKNPNRATIHNFSQFLHLRSRPNAAIFYVHRYRGSIGAMPRKS